MKRIKKVIAIAALVSASALPALAQSNVSDIVDGAETVFNTVAVVCVSMGVFFIGYRIAKRVR